MEKQNRACYIVLCYNDFNNSIETLEGIKKEREVCPIDIVVVDNGSCDIYASRLKSYCEENDIIYLFREVNDGYTGGNNYAWKMFHNKYKYIIIANNDICFNSNKTLSKIIEVFKKRTDIGIAGPVVKYGDGMVVEKSKVLGLTFKKGINGHRFVTSKEYMECDSIIGCYLAINTDIVKFSNLFNESFFMYGEELDFCLRVWNEGFAVVRINDEESSIYHKGGNNPFGSGLDVVWKYYLTERNLVLCSKSLNGFTKTKYFVILFFSLVYRCLIKLTKVERKYVLEGFFNGIQFIKHNYSDEQILDDALRVLEKSNKG